MTPGGRVDTSRTHWKYDKRKFSSADEALRGTQQEVDSMERAAEGARQARLDAAALAYREEQRAVEAYQAVLAREEDARAILRETPGRSGQLEAEVAAAEARTAVLVTQLPGTPEEIRDRLRERVALLEASANPAPSGHTPQ